MSADVHLCGADEIGLVMRFIETYWAKGHVLAHDRGLIDWQHRRADGDYNFIVAKRGNDSELLGVLGFIPTARYDQSLADDETVWLAVWKVRPTGAPGGLGLALLRELTALHAASAIAVVGIGPAEHIGMYRALGFATGELSQYYMLNATRDDFELASLPAEPPRGPIANGSARLSEVGKRDFGDAVRRVSIDGDANPRKSTRYFESRFFDHPVYEYQLYLVESSAGAGVVAARRATHDGRTALRIVDFLGSEAVFAECGPGVQQLVQSVHAEYADVWNAGFATSTFDRAGFHKVDPDGAVVIPNYFEPFLQRNARISYALRSRSKRPLAIFRADGDQDRPNMIPVRS